MPGFWGLRYADVDVEFTDESGIYLHEHPDIGSPDITAQDSDLPGTDGTAVGQDTHGAVTIGLSFGVDGPDPDTVRARRAMLGRWWNAARVRTTAGALVELVSDTGRSAFGRPRELANAAVRLTDSPPRIDVEANFRQTDPLWYGPEQSITVPLALAQGGGLKSPLKSPLVARGYTTRANTFTVGGEEPTWGVYVVRGPILNPVVEVAGVLRFAAAVSLAYDEWLTIDTRPGQRSVLRNGQRIAALSRTSTSLAAAALPPGGHTITLSGSSSTGNPSATLMWRDAHPTP